MSVLVVAGRSPSTIETALQEVQSRRLEPDSMTRTDIVEASPAVVVLDHRSLDDESVALLETVRSSEAIVPVVLVTDDVAAAPPLRAVDRLVTRPFEPETLQDAVERSLLVSEYDHAVSELFDRAVSKASEPDGSPAVPRDLQQLRQDADVLLDDLVALDDPDLLAALLAESPDLPTSEE